MKDKPKKEQKSENIEKQQTKGTNTMITNTKKTEFPCPVKGCKNPPKKPMTSQQAVNMHVNRVHTKIIKTPGQLGAAWIDTRSIKKQNPVSQLLESEKERQRKLKNAANARTRARNIAKGLRGDGKPRRRPYAPRNQDLVERRKARNEYKRNWYQNKKAKKLDPNATRAPLAVAIERAKARTGKRKLPYTWPLMKVTTATEPEVAEPLTLDSVRDEVIDRIAKTYIEMYLR